MKERAIRVIDATQKIKLVVWWGVVVDDYINVGDVQNRRKKQVGYISKKKLLSRSNPTMKVILFVFLAIYIVTAEEKYSDKYDYVDVDKILTDDGLREQYYNCYMGNSACVTPDAQYFKGK